MTDKPEVVVRTAQSNNPSARQAVVELQQQLAGQQAAVMMFFASVRYDLAELAATLKSHFSCPLVGCTTAGEIGPDGYADDTITAFSIESGKLLAYPNFIPELSKFKAGCTQRIADSVHAQVKQAAESIPDGKPFGFLLIDGLSLREEQVIGHLYHSLESIPIVGGSAGGGNLIAPTQVYWDGQFHRDAAVFTTFFTSHRFELFRTQHFIPTDQKLVVTRADPAKRIVYEINGKPAAAEYARLIGVDIPSIEYMTFAMHPLMIRVGGECYVRSVMNLNPDGSLTFACAIDEGLVLILAQGVDMVENLSCALDHLQARLNPRIIIGCECYFRKLEVLSRDIRDSISRIMARNHVIGFHTYGEQIDGLHVNQTFTGVAIGE